jgi:hypothetical protein
MRLLGMGPANRTGLLIRDDYRRADTADGDTGPLWALKQFNMALPLDPSPYGRIEDEMFVADAGRVVYSTRQETVAVRRIKAQVSWIVNPAFNGGEAATGAATAALLVSSNSNFIVDMGIHATFARAGSAVFQKRYNGGSFETLGATNQHGFLANGAVHEIETWVSASGDWGVKVNGDVLLSGVDDTLNDHLSGYWAHEIFQNGANHVDLVRFHRIEAWAE